MFLSAARYFCFSLSFITPFIFALPVDSCTEQHQCHDLTALLHKAPQQYSVLHQVINTPEKYRPQIIYTQVHRPEHGLPQLTTFHYQVNNQQYFYPASTVKLPVSLLALEWLDNSDIKGVNANTTMLTDSNRPEQTTAYHDRTAENGLPSIAHYIKKVMIVSDNDGYNRLYELLGSDYINTALHQKGLTSVILNQRLSVPYSYEQNRYTNPVRFVDVDNKLLHAEEAKVATQQHLNPAEPVLGKGYYQQQQLIKEPMSFTDKNRISLPDLDGVLKRLILPELFEPQQRFQLSTASRQFMLDAMSTLPPDSTSPSYDKEQYPDNYAKFVMFGGPAADIPARYQIFNKIGSAYGQMLDVAYFVDKEKQIEFFVTVVIYVNEDEILNDDIYEYDRIGLPFMNQLGHYLYQLAESDQK